MGYDAAKEIIEAQLGKGIYSSWLDDESGLSVAYHVILEYRNYENAYRLVRSQNLGDGIFYERLWWSMLDW